MTQAHETTPVDGAGPDSAPPSRLGIALLAGGAFLLLLTGLLLWWREEDGDVADGLVDASTDLAPTGQICRPTNFKWQGRRVCFCGDARCIGPAELPPVRPMAFPVER